MEIILEKLDSSSKIEPSANNDENENKENKPSEEIKSDKTLLDIIKSRPKRFNRKVPSRLKPGAKKDDLETATSEKRPCDGTKKVNDVNSLDSGLDTFFQSTSITLMRRTFGDVYPVDDISSRHSLSLLSQKKCIKTNQLDKNSKMKTEKDESSNNDNNDKQDKNKLCPLWADKVSRSRSSPNLIDPKKMLMPSDPRVNLSIIKELRTRQKTGETGETGEISNKNTANNNHHLSLLTELKAKNKPLCPKNDSARSSVNNDKPPVSILKPSIIPSSSSTSFSNSSTVQQSGQFFNVKLREIKSNNRAANSLIKSYTRASFTVKEDGNETRNSVQNGKDDKVGDEGDGDGDGEKTRLSVEASALDTEKNEKKNDRSIEESSSSSSSSSSEEDEKENDNDDHQSKSEAKTLTKLACYPVD